MNQNNQMEAKLIINLSDIFAGKEGVDGQKFFDGIPIKKASLDGVTYYCVRWPQSTNGIAGGWYKAEQLLVM